MKSKNTNLMIALMSILLGLLFIILKGNIISVALTIIGIVVIIMAIIDFCNKETVHGIIKAVLGVCILIFGWMFVDLALYIVAAVLLIQGLIEIVNAIRCKNSIASVQKIIYFIKPVICIVAGLCLLFNQGATIDWIFILVGVLLAVNGVLSLTSYSKN